ncbi:BTAD domain-containing putative transcriptional regulator [Actinomadura sp. HBU206391]|uniref:BTAD domain-containing putative transcriptional regulator n=1 Tax=Actinomadura sp. HBU206391 TaxID=2731692 RepID=UPI002905B705|nr:BTAD domain-containing putative transcriptional regulator [Actinomadura sp. HBU206391]
MLQGLAAVAALAALVAGVPFALLTFFGSPVPDHLPTVDDLTQRLGPSSLITILVSLVWLAWLQLSICVLVEVYAGVRGVGVPARVPLAGGTQSLVHRLVVTALLLFTATTAIMPAFASRDLHPARPVQTQSQQLQRIPATPAEVSAPELAESVQSPPVHKAKAKKIYRVQPPHGRHHESLWEIADKCLGDGRRYPEIYELNKGRQQPDGTRLTIASLIRPGWVLVMPDDAVGAQVVPAHDLDDYSTHGKAKPDRQDLAEPLPQAPPAGADQSASGGAHAAVPAPRAGAADRQPEQGAGEHRPAASEPAGEQAGEQTVRDDAGTSGAEQQEPHEAAPAAHAYDFGWPQGLAVASLLAAGLLAALGRRRREQMWHRAFGQMILRPEGDAAVAEQALRLGADTEATRLLDLGLRQMSKALAADGRTPPTVYGVHLGSDSLDLWIAPADRNPPEPWEAHDSGQVWRLHRDRIGDLALEPDGLRDVLAPYPGLISIGTNDNGRIMVDLEAAHGLIVLRGPEEVRRAVLAAVAIELATNRWSDHMRITLVGFGEELSHIAPDRIRAVGSLAEALPELEARAEEVRQALAASGADSVLTGRCRGVFGEAWMPHYLIMADQPTTEEADRLVALARTGQRMAAGYIVPGDVQGATWTWEVDQVGRMQAGVLGFDVEAQMVPGHHYRAVVELFRTAGRLDGVALPEPAGEPTAGVVPAEQQPVVDVRLLGPIEVDAPGPMEQTRRALCTEVLVYLATHPGGVHPTVLSGAVWPRGVTAGVRDATIARVSDWLGRDSRGRPNLYYDDGGRIRLGSEVRVDWSVLRWLIWRSAAEPASETAYMSYALDLVRGPLLADRPRGRYAWLAADDLEYEAGGRVVDVAHRLVVLRLDDGDARGAIAAARAGLRLAPGDEGLWRDLLRATHATGDQAQVRVVAEELRRQAERDAMLGHMQPETEAMIDEFVPQYRRVSI